MAAKNADNPSLSAEKLKGQQIELILRQLESVPTLPEVATRLLKLTSSNQANTQEVINLVSADQSLTAKILSLAGRANTGLRKEARTISRVVVMLGFEAVRSAVLSIKVFEMFGPKGLSVSGLDRREFWKHCLAVACASDLLGQRLRLGIESEELFVCGLLHDIGKLAMEQCLPKSYTRVVQACNSQYGNIAEYERQILGVDHTIAGRRLAELWHLPELVEQTIWLHHQPVEGLPEVLSGRRAIAVVHLADTIVREQRFGYSGNFTFPADSTKLAAQIGVSAEVLKETIDRLPGLIEERSQLFGVGKTTSESLYRSALTAANLELSRLNCRLQRRAAQAGSQSKALGLLRRFGSELTAAESLGSLCRLMARTWAEAGQLAPSQDEPVIAYVFSSADQAIVLASQTGTEEAEVKLLVSRGDFPPSRPLALGAGGADVLKQLVEDEDALAEVVARTCSAHWPLVCGRQWIGGLFWSPGATRADLTEETIQALAMS
ncbi:MAG: HDOD domain-containing protein, partial [Planctomycetes bacterium]|nr:HDOD domain-containing protein [Planctomycetota bacterium]